MDCLSERVTQRIRRLKGRQAGQRFSELVRGCVQGEWQQAFFPELNAAGQAYVPLLDRTFTSRVIAQRTTAYALAMAVLYESPDDAFCHLLNCQKGRQHVDEDLKPTPSERNRNSTATAPNRASNNRLDRAVASFMDGRSIHLACSDSGVSRAALEHFLRDSLRGFGPVNSRLGASVEMAPSSPRTSASGEDPRSEGPPQQV